MESYNILIEETTLGLPNLSMLNTKEKLFVVQRESSNLPQNLGNQQKL